MYDVFKYNEHVKFLDLDVQYILLVVSLNIGYTINEIVTHFSLHVCLI